MLEALQNNARLSNKELAAVAGLAPSSTHARVARLVERGLIEGFHAAVRPEALGVGLQALVYVRMADHKRDQLEAFWQHLLALPEVMQAYYVGGDDDVLAHVGVRDTPHLESLVMDAISARPEVGRVRTVILFRHVRRGGVA